QLDVGNRHGRRASWLAVYQSHLTKNIVSSELGHCSVTDLNTYVTALDNEKLIGLFALAENDATGLYSPGRDIISRQQVELCIGRHFQPHANADQDKCARRAVSPLSLPNTAATSSPSSQVAKIRAKTGSTVNRKSAWPRARSTPKPSLCCESSTIAAP